MNKVVGIFLFLLMLLVSSCEPLANSFGETEDAEYFYAKSITTLPDTFSVIRVMTWNIRFGAGRIPWFGDACGNRVILTEDEVYSSLQAIADKINAVKPDVLLLQEVDMNSKRSAYINELQWILDHTYFNYAVYGSQWRAQFIPSDGLGRMEEGNVILSRWKIQDAKRIQLQLRNDQDNLTRYFYERCCMVTGRIEIPHVDNLYAVNIHASAFATDDTKQKHIVQFQDELNNIDKSGGWFVAGGDLNTLPPGSDTTDYCIEDMCPGESFHDSYDDPEHKEGSNYTPEIHWLDTLYSTYECAVPSEIYSTNQYNCFTHTTRGSHFWDRTLDYLFTNYQWVENSVITHQDATKESDHAPVTVLFNYPNNGEHMKRIVLCVIGLFLFSELFAQDTVTKNYWTDGTAYTIPKKRWELGLFTASRYGITNRIELSAHPLMFFLMPQVSIKVGWGEYSGFMLATEHGIFYPTVFMNLVARKGTGGLISPEYTIPQMFAIYNRFLTSCRPFGNAILTGHAGIAFSIKFSPLDPQSTIDLPVIYPRLAVFYNQPEFDAGIDFRGKFIPRFGWLFNVENFFVCGTPENYFMENKGVLAYTSKKETLRIEAGYKLCFGRYPSGPQWHLLPVIDLIFGIGR